MENNNKIIEDLKELVAIANDGKEGYTTSAEDTESPLLKQFFIKLAMQRAGFATELKEHIATHGGDSDNESGGILGILHRTWIDIKQALSGKEDKAILVAIKTGEEAALEKYDEVISNYHDHHDHLQLLQKQRESIKSALLEIDNLSNSYN